MSNLPYFDHRLLDSELARLYLKMFEFEGTQPAQKHQSAGNMAIYQDRHAAQLAWGVIGRRRQKKIPIPGDSSQKWCWFGWLVCWLIGWLVGLCCGVRMGTGRDEDRQRRGDGETGTGRGYVTGINRIHQTSGRRPHRMQRERERARRDGETEETGRRGDGDRPVHIPCP